MTRARPKPRRVRSYVIIAVFIKKNPRVTKFKLRRGKYLFTFKADKPNVIQAIQNGLGKDIEKVEIRKRRVVAKKAAKK